MQKFKAFSEVYLSEKIIYLDNDREYIDDMSYFVSGSDQVWNPIEIAQMDKYFLTFAPKFKRITYAPSFGRSELPTTLQKKYKNWIDGLAAISVRKDAGADIIKQLTGREAPVLADPTLLLSKTEWLSIAKKATNRPNTPYLLTYFLGGPTPETRKKLEKLAEEKNMSIINLGDISETETYKTGPSEFLDYISNASAFFTDSFHGVVFSIIFQTPFVVYERLSPGASMYSRIETILNKFNMRNREAKDFKEDIFSMDFSTADEILIKEYEKSISYLKDSLR